jgi:hypothetical protein
MHLIIDETIVSELPDLLPLLLKAWPGTGTLVSSGPLSKCLAAVDDRSADAAIVRIQGLEVSEIGKLAALPLATALDGTVLLHAAGSREGLFARLRDVVQVHRQSDPSDGQVWR